MAKYQPGESGNPLGRARGVPNKATREARTLARDLVSNPTYLQRFKARLLAGKLPPLLEALCWHYAYGRPALSVELHQPDRPVAPFLLFFSDGLQSCLLPGRGTFERVRDNPTLFSWVPAPGADVDDVDDDAPVSALNTSG